MMCRTSIQRIIYVYSSNISIDCTLIDCLCMLLSHFFFTFITFYLYSKSKLKVVFTFRTGSML